jgi:SAM-dependent methyltransferase
MTATAPARSARKIKYELSACTVCGGRDASLVADQDDLKLELERVWDFHSARFRHPVPTGFLTDRVVFSQQPAWRLLSCSGCGHLYRSPRETPDSIRRTYANEPPSEDVYEAMYERQRETYHEHVARLQAFSPGIQHGLEVGSYTGGFLAAALEAGLTFTGIDVNPCAAAFATRHGVTIATGSLEHLNPSQLYDVIVIWNTFEQLPNVKSACIIAHRLLREGGVLAVRVPNSEFYIRWRTRRNGPLAAWAERVLIHNNLLGFPYREGFTGRSLSRLLDETGFTIGRVHGDTLVPVSDRFTRRTAALDEWLTKKIQRITQHGWRAPWVEVYSTRLPA